MAFLLAVIPTRVSARNMQVEDDKIPIRRAIQIALPIIFEPCSLASRTAGDTIPGTPFLLKAWYSVCVPFLLSKALCARVEATLVVVVTTRKKKVKPK